MKKKIGVASAMLLMLSLPQIATADDFSTGVKVSTLGPGLEFETRLSENFGIRAGANYLPITVSVTADDIDYDADFSWKTVSVMADIYPFSGIFRITGGLFYNGNDVDVSGTPSDNVNIGNHTYTPAQVGTISGSLGFNTLAPYAGIGWSGGDTTSGNWTISFDLGVMFQGSATVDELSASGLLGSNATFVNDLNQEKADLEDEMEPYQYYPVVAVTLAYFW
jgi:hypothetical protein